MPESTISGMMQGIYIAQQNFIVERRHILGGLCSMAPYKNGIDLSRGTLLLSRFCMSLYRRTKTFKFQKSKGCCISLLSCNSCLQSFMQPGVPGMICQSRDLRLLSNTAGVAAQNIEWNTMLLRDKHLKGAIVHEAEKGYGDCQGKTMRFSEFLSSRILPLCSPLVDKPAKVLLEEVKNYSQASIQCRFRVLNKIALLMGFESIHSLIAHERALIESTLSLQYSSKNEDKSESATSLPNRVHGCDEHEVRRTPSSVDDTELFQACQTFPCIVLGSTPHVNIYSMTDENSEGAEYRYIENDVENPVKQVEDVNIIAVTIPEIPNLGEDKSDQAAAQFENDVEPAQYMLRKDKKCLHLSNEVKLEITNKVGLKEDCIMADTKVSPSKFIRNTKRRTTYVDCFLDAPVGTVNGITAFQRRKLEENGFHTVRKLLQHFPCSYFNFQDAQGQPEDGQLLNFTGRVLSSSGQKRGHLRGLIEVIVECQIRRADESCSESNLNCDKMENKKTIYLHLKRYVRGPRFANFGFLSKAEAKYPEGSHVAVSGKVMALKEEDHFEMQHYILDILEGEIDLERQEPYEKEKIYPIYPSKGTLDRKYIGDRIKRVLDSLPVDIDPLPENVCAKFSLMELREAYFGIHFPKDQKEAESARRRFIFDDFFYHQLGLQFRMHEVVNMYTKNNGLAENSIGLEVGSLGIDNWSQLTLKLLRSLPFSLTNSQLKVTSEIIWDLRRPVPMNRLLQGDVGCGKTIVALLAALEVIDSGYQAAFMVPTELLAMQHYENIVSILEKIDEVERPSVALLTGSTPLKKASSICEGLETGDIAMIVGTHSLIAERVKFASLCFAVIDEQHRFGVIQRGRFSSKVSTTMDLTLSNDINLQDGQLVANKAFASPHVLVMSATPIPRTLALVLYGDMSLSQIKESLPGRLPVKTFSFYGDEQGFQRAYQMMQEDLGNGGKIFLVYPVIDESKMLPELHAATAELDKISNIFKDYKCGILHGRMKLSEKETAMQKFRGGETQILLSTQIIEIGIDIPEATMMVIINAERFGMAQLHQLRGRIGRSTRQATCILLASSRNALERLRLLENSSDGFYLAEKDLHFRGPGNLLGIQQSGHIPEFSIARLETDGDVLEQAHIAASDILQKNRYLEGLAKLKVELSMRHSWNTFVP
ncbi:ATP-dependent DNA helicase homolog RECG, chloroplastic isoform X2 [Cryptomeria japonica]|uniref:ATP-dependent DNA helicase homolog RECG, chloroplastic isoform X2 n=1 Tax=Cryptomeria japonica TaxID=3369 RepID=UPI0027DA6504|nr:ATP-dependent DNA helicase homolog RECG, chloroplastic isoform X2 [Cryptomeria japonica]